jgi:hypothetical protein
MLRKNTIPLIEAEMFALARIAVFEDADWLTAAQVTAIAGSSEKNLSAQLQEAAVDGAIFFINRNGEDYFPGYALDPEQSYLPYRALRTVIEHFKPTKDGWSLAFWFQSVNSFLGGKRPMDLLAEKPDEVIAAAADVSMGTAHA